MGHYLGWTRTYFYLHHAKLGKLGCILLTSEFGGFCVTLEVTAGLEEEGEAIMTEIRGNLEKTVRKLGSPLQGFKRNGNFY